MSNENLKKKADLKVIILGDYSVGKTAFICRYIEGTFQIHESTIGAAFFLKQWGPHNIAVWDTAGDERYTGLSNFYCRNAGAAILAYDMTRITSYESLWARFIPLLDAANEDCLKVVVGMKMDLLAESERDITFEEGCRFSREINEKMDFEKVSRPPYFETSSLTGANVKDVFEYIFEYCLPLDETQKKDMQRSTVCLENGNEQRKKCC